MERKRIVSGIRPTGDLHIGHYLGVLKNWVELQKEYQCFYFAADWHALTTEYRDPGVITQSTKDMVMTWLSVGLNPEESVLFRQSDIKAHAELFLLLSMITPISWLERNPTYKELKEELKEKDLSNLGFLGYPVLQAADIVIYHADRVPIGEDQLPHLELTREIVRRFNFIYGEGTFREPKEILTDAARVLGIDGRKMSKSYGNAIFIYETEESLKGKVMQMFTDVKRLRRKDPGEPKDCNLYPLHEYFTDEGVREEIQAGCRSASLGCVDCKKILLQNLIREFSPIWEKIDYYRGHASLVDDVLREGARRAKEESDATMEKVRSVMKLVR
ncbi:MAG TPA: tryptophan--tRNA ligase [Deltaproteobacteria bacterium]|jgi:tryptophanyl-tRNA synthetase|nr:tryptophan--tRNA ligase [Deltaproteobacteria bacterium]HOI08546.1 tryptophan--tRNA ligase [Deltaproteobacteria bacterium]